MSGQDFWKNYDAKKAAEAEAKREQQRKAAQYEAERPQREREEQARQNRLAEARRAKIAEIDPWVKENLGEIANRTLIGHYEISRENDCWTASLPDGRSISVYAGISTEGRLSAFVVVTSGDIYSSHYAGEREFADRQERDLVGVTKLQQLLVKAVEKYPPITGETRRQAIKSKEHASWAEGQNRMLPNND